VAGLPCPACGEPLGEGFAFCDACGVELAVAARTAAGAVPSTVDGDGTAPVGSLGRWVAAPGPPDEATCTGCGGTAFGVEGYCDTCGQRRPAGPDHSELDLPGVAVVTDKGRRHKHNEDAAGLAALPGVRAAVVCDGVSSSSRPEAASHAAVDAAVPALVSALRGGGDAGTALRTAARAAQAAATLAGGASPGGNPPSSTFVAAVAHADTVTVAWIGDSRAYWLPVPAGPPAAPATCLTVDDASPGGLLRWLGADARDTEPHLRTFTPAGPGLVLVCSDGLFRYRPDPVELAALATAAVPDPAAAPLALAQALVRFALDQGGQDNVTAAVLPFPPQEP